MSLHRLILPVSLVFAVIGSSAFAPSSLAETLWIEAEHLEGIRGFCWPMGQPKMKETAGHWGLSGPGWAAEWNQGGESGFLSIATAASDDRASATKSVEIPTTDDYYLWVRYGDWRETTERFNVQIDQDGKPPFRATFGERAVVDEDNEMKLYYGWAFAWDMRPLKLAKGSSKITLSTTTKDTHPRQVDVLVLTTDASYRPRIKERPRSAAIDYLESLRRDRPRDLAPLARRAEPIDLPAAWKLHTFRDEGFVYLWNVSHTDALTTWLGEKPDRVRSPYNIGDKTVREAFEKQYAGKSDAPLFGDPRIVPAFHGVGAGVFATDPKTGEVNPTGLAFARWLDQNPTRKWAMMMNYHNGQPIGEKGQALFAKYRDRYVGSISGESLGYFYPADHALAKATETSQTRRQLAAAITPVALASNAAKYRAVYGKDLDANPFADVISCHSVGNIAFIPLAADWGAKTIGYESSAMTYSLLPMRWAFMRGAARQFGGCTCTYRSCNMGDASTIFSETSSFATPKAILDNYYSVYSGAGMTWYKFDIWYQYMAGASMFYHEQGFDEFWLPGGTAAAGQHELSLSPKGKLVDRFLRVTAQHRDRGTPFTPVAFLLDYAHGWEPSPFWPNSFNNYHEHPDRFLYGPHEQMLSQYFAAAWHPLIPESEKPMTATNEVNVPGVFGDLFDVILAYPDAAKWKTIDSYPVVIAAGEIELTAPEGARLADYIQRGGTLVVAQGHLTGPGAAALNLPPHAAATVAEAEGFRWLDGKELLPSQRFRYYPLRSSPGDRPLAATREGDVFCLASDRGQGRLIYLSVPYGLGIDRQLHPATARLLAHVSRGLTPIEVEGDVEWLLNRTDSGWLVTLLNPAGQQKPQQGITPTDYRQNRSVTIRSRSKISSASDWLLPDQPLPLKANQLDLEVLAGGVRIIELKP